MSFMNTTTSNQPAQKYAFRSLLLPPPQKIVVPRNAQEMRVAKLLKRNRSCSKHKRKVGYDQSILFSGLTQLHKGNPITKLQTLQTLTQLNRIQDPNYRATIKDLTTMWNPDTGKPFVVDSSSISLQKQAIKDISRHAAELKMVCGPKKCDCKSNNCTQCRARNHLNSVQLVQNDESFFTQGNVQVQHNFKATTPALKPENLSVYQSDVRPQHKTWKKEKPMEYMPFLPLLNLTDMYVSSSIGDKNKFKLTKGIAMIDTGATSTYFTKDFISRVPHTVQKRDQVVRISTLTDDCMELVTDEVAVVLSSAKQQLVVVGFLVERIMEFTTCKHLNQSVQQVCSKVPPPLPSKVTHVFNKTTKQSVDILLGIPFCAQTMTHISPIIIENMLRLPLCTYMHTIFGKSIPWGSFPLKCPGKQNDKCGGHNYIVHHIKVNAGPPVVKPHKRGEGNLALAEALSVLWRYDSTDTDKTEKLTQAELECYNFTLANIQYDAKTPIYSVKLPWIGGKPPALPNTYRICKTRFLSMERTLREKMARNPQNKDHIYKLVEDSVQGNIDAGYWKALPEELYDKYMDPLNSNVYFAPPRLVWRMDHESTPVRFTFDCSQRCPGVSYSLNDCQYIGHRLLPDIPVLLLRLRAYETVCQMDLKKMFLSIRVHGSPYEDESDVPKQCFLWRKPLTDDPIKIYYSDRIFWGSACAPYLASVVVNEHLRTQLEKAQQEKNSLKIEACELLMRSIYADDVMFSYPCPKKCIQLIDTIESIMAEAGFKTAKWKSNNKLVLNHIRQRYGKDKLSKTHQQLFLSAAPFQSMDVEREKLEDALELVTGEDKALGIILNNCWNEFSFGGHNGLYKELKSISRHSFRTLARSIAVTAYDPIGFSSPFVLKCRLLMREAMKRSKEQGNRVTKEFWSALLPADIDNKFEQWYNQLPQLNTLKLKSCIHFHPEKTTFFCFSDASNVGIGVVIYSRSEMPNGEIFTNLVRSKCKVRPMSMPIVESKGKETTEEKEVIEDMQFSVPRLELMAAVESLKYIKELQEAYGVKPEKVRCYTDSSCVYFWLRTESSKLLPFVAHRCDKIKQAGVMFDFCPTGAQAADIVAKGGDVEEIRSNEMWNLGPRFIRSGRIEALEKFHPLNLDKKKTKYLLGIRKAKIQQCLHLMNLPENEGPVHNKVQLCMKIINVKPDVNQFMVQMLTAKSPNVAPLLHKEDRLISAFNVKASPVRQDPVSRLMKTYSQLDKLYSAIAVWLTLLKGAVHAKRNKISLKEGIRYAQTMINRNLIQVQAEMLCINRYQKDKFGEEFNLLQQGRPVPMNSPLYELNPIITVEQSIPVMRMNSRLINASPDIVPKDMSRPLILDKPDFKDRYDHAVSILIKVHRDRHHCSVDTLQATIEQKYYVKGLRVACKTVRKVCIVCTRATPKGVNAKQISAALPVERLDPTVGCFTRISVDTCGPFYLHSGWRETDDGSTRSTKPTKKNSKKAHKKTKVEEATEYLAVQPPLKAHILVVSCLVSRYACFYLIPSLSAIDILDALEWHFGSFGVPRRILSDNFSTLKNVAGTLKEIRDNNKQKFDTFTLHHKFEWTFTPPYTAWRNGCAEAHVRLIKESLAKVLEKRTHTYYDLMTSIKFMELHINARPLISFDQNDNSQDLCLTPQKLVYGRDLNQLDIAQELVELSPVNLEKQYKKRYLLQEHFVKVFKEKYMIFLRKRNCWMGNEQPPLKEGDICLWAGAELGSKTPLPKKGWPVCRIIECSKSKDETTRTYRVRILLKRPQNKDNPIKEVIKIVPAQALCPLESMAHAQSCIFRQQDAEIAEKLKVNEPIKNVKPAQANKKKRAKRTKVAPATDRVLRSRANQSAVAQSTDWTYNSLSYHQVKERDKTYATCFLRHLTY